MQQATCAHSGADTGTSSGNIEISSATTRRSLLGLAAGAIAILVPTAAIAATALRSVERAAWDRAMLVFTSADAAADAYTASIKRNPKASLAERKEEDRLIDAMLDAENVLMNLPAPDVIALSWKLDRLLVDECGFTPSWAMEHVGQTLLDARNLAGAA